MAAAKHTYAVRLAVEGGGRVKAELVQVGESGERSLRKIESSSGRASRGLGGLMDRTRALGVGIRALAGALAGVATVGGLAALADTALIERARLHNDKWRAWTVKQLRGLGPEVPQSHCNFVLVRFGDEPDRDAAAADRFLKARGIIARGMAAYGLPESLRITIGLEDEMRAVVAALTDFVADR